MNSKIISVSDYYPLKWDIAEMSGDEIPEVSTVNLSADELLALANAKNMNAVQKLVLLVKNALEGDLCHLNNISIEKLVEMGTFHFDLEFDVTSKDLSGEFFNHFSHLYRKGIETAWHNAHSAADKPEANDFQTMLNFILANQLFRLPVSFMESYDPQKFSGLSTAQRNHFRLQKMLNTSILNHVCERSFIDTVNNTYFEKFRDLLLKLESKENVLKNLFVKLDFANDPKVTSDDQLEKLYFQYIVSSNVRNTEKGRALPNPGIVACDGDKTVHDQLKTQIKKLYKLIAKNCREVHSQAEGESRYPALTQYFMVGSNLYNDFVFDFNKLILQYTSLLMLLIKVINYRKANRLEVVFSDFTGLADHFTYEISEEDIYNCCNNLNKILEIMRAVDFTDFKVKHIRDEEMSKIHRDFLHREIDFLDEKIMLVVEEIRRAMNKKTQNNPL